jgi:4-hydroxy-3-polyprenylbenzoate decarboxylase
MPYKSLHETVLDLEKNGQLLRIKEEVSPDLDIASVHRRVFDANGPAILFEKVKNSPFPAVSNIYGTNERTAFLFRETLEAVKKVIELKLDPTNFLKKPTRYLGAPLTALTSLPRRQFLGNPILFGETTIDKLPLIKSWPMDGGAFVTMPQVYSEDPDRLGIMGSNIGMYRIQLTGNQYVTNNEIGLHYQLHRGIGVHHTKYNQRPNEPFRCSVFVGGPPSHAFSAIMPLPEGLPEVLFAGMLGGRRFRYTKHDGYTLSSDADFVITGEILRNVKKPEGPFGDHLGYYSLEHDFPVLKVHKVHYRKNAIWHFSVVGRPPMEDSAFGWLIHQLVAPLTSQEFPGVQEIHAVDVAGVHPLLLAIGNERYMPFRTRKPEEILSQANRILGSGQTSLAKWLWIAATETTAPNLSTKNIPTFLNHILERVDWASDLHFHTNTTMDTLDYSGSGWNAGSKVVVACCGEKRRELATNLPENLQLPAGFSAPRMILPGILAVKSPKYLDSKSSQIEAENFTKAIQLIDNQSIMMIVLCDDADFVAANPTNFLWVTFTRSNPSHDIHGIGSFTENKHWGCRGALVVDARVKPHHAPELVEDTDSGHRADAILGRAGFKF